MQMKSVNSQMTSKIIANVYFISFELNGKVFSVFKDVFSGKWDIIIFCDKLSFVILPMVSEVWLPTTRRSIG